MRLRTKFTLTLLLISVISAALVGGMAYWLLMRDFRQSVLDQAFENFQADMSAYLQTYGSLAEGNRREPFHAFVQRTRHPPDIQVDIPPIDSAFPKRNGIPPFRFMLLDPEGRVLKSGGDYVIGDVVAESLRLQARPISVNGKVAVLALPQGEPSLSPQDLSYLAAMRRALLIGFIVAGSLAVVIGLVLARRMSATLEELTLAIRNMHMEGATGQKVPVRSRDEIGVLAETFNAMTTELTQAHDELKELSIRDPLTQLYNRRHFAEQAATLYQQARRYDHPLSLMVGDLDHFKQINDTFSHKVGDEVLCRVANLLTLNTRKSDVIARHGGEEFVIAFTETTLEQAVARCEELRRKIEAEPWSCIHPDLRVSMSMGVSGMVGEAAQIETLLHEADLRLYKAKQSGRNQVISTD